MSTLPDDYDGNTPLYACVGGCHEFLPREAFPGTKDKFTKRCKAPPYGNGCDAQYRRDKRAEKRVVSTATDIEGIAAEIAAGRKDLSNLTEAQKAERRKNQDRVNRMLRELPKNERELYELETMYDILLEDARGEGVLSCDWHSSLVEYKLSLKQVEVPTGAPEAPADVSPRARHFLGTILRRIHFLRSQTELFDETARELAHTRERERLLKNGGLFAGSGEYGGHYGAGCTYDDPKDMDAANKIIDKWYRQYVKRRRVEELAVRAKAASRPTPEEFAEFLSENLYFVDDSLFIERFYNGHRPGSGGAGADFKCIMATRAGDDRSARKWEQAAHESDLAERLYEDEVKPVVLRYFTNKYAGQEMPTWAELVPIQYSAEVLDEMYSGRQIDNAALVDAWREQRWVILSDDDIEKVRRRVAGGIDVFSFMSGSPEDFRRHEFYGLDPNWGRAAREWPKYVLDIGTDVA